MLKRIRAIATHKSKRLNKRARKQFLEAQEGYLNSIIECEDRIKEIRAYNLEGLPIELKKQFEGNLEKFKEIKATFEHYYMTTERAIQSLERTSKL